MGLHDQIMANKEKEPNFLAIAMAWFFVATCAIGIMVYLYLVARDGFSLNYLLMFILFIYTGLFFILLALYPKGLPKWARYIVPKVAQKAFTENFAFSNKERAKLEVKSVALVCLVNAFVGVGFALGGAETAILLGVVGFLLAWLIK
jgi:hypothetical protein